MEQTDVTIDPKYVFPIIIEQLTLGREASFTVTGKSMWPFLCNGRDRVIIQSCDAEALRVGDIVLFQTPFRNYMMHRITALSGDSFETTGDGNIFRDGRFPIECVIARVESVVRKGKTIRNNDLWWCFLSSVWMLLFPVRGFLLYILKRIGWIKAGILGWIKKH